MFRGREERMITCISTKLLFCIRNCKNILIPCSIQITIAILNSLLLYVKNIPQLMYIQNKLAIQ